MPIVAGILGLFAMVTQNMKRFRILMFTLGIMWLIYNTVTEAWVALISQTITQISVTIAIFRYDIKKRWSENGIEKM